MDIENLKLGMVVLLNTWTVARSDPHLVYCSYSFFHPIIRTLPVLMLGSTCAADAGPKKGGLKEFVEKFKDRHYYVIEMRIVLVCCVGVFFKLFFSDVILEAEEGALTYSALTFVCCKY